MHDCCVPHLKLQPKTRTHTGQPQLIATKSPCNSNLASTCTDKLACNESCRAAAALQVVIRVRPPLARELQGYRPFENAAIVDPSQRVITLSENLQSLTANGGQIQSPDNGMVCAEAVPASLDHTEMALLECPIHLLGSSVFPHCAAIPKASADKLASATVSALHFKTKQHAQQEQLQQAIHSWSAGHTLCRKERKEKSMHFGNHSRSLQI